MEVSIQRAPIAHWRSSDKTEQLLEAHLEGFSRLSRTFAAKIGLQDAGELIGAQYVWSTLAGKGTHERIAAQVLSLCIASHHSRLIDCTSTAKRRLPRKSCKVSWRSQPQFHRLRRHSERNRHARRREAHPQARLSAATFCAPSTPAPGSDASAPAHE